MLVIGPSFLVHYICLQQRHLILMLTIEIKWISIIISFYYLLKCNLPIAQHILLLVGRSQSGSIERRRQAYWLEQTDK